jgi:hypothetical protein
MLVDIGCPVTIVFLAITGKPNLRIHAWTVIAFGDCVR